MPSATKRGKALDVAARAPGQSTLPLVFRKYNAPVPDQVEHIDGRGQKRKAPTSVEASTSPPGSDVSLANRVTCGSSESQAPPEYTTHSEGSSLRERLAQRTASPGSCLDSLQESVPQESTLQRPHKALGGLSLDWRLLLLQGARKRNAESPMQKQEDCLSYPSCVRASRIPTVSPCPSSVRPSLSDQSEDPAAGLEASCVRGPGPNLSKLLDQAMEDLGCTALDLERALEAVIDDEELGRLDLENPLGCDVEDAELSSILCREALAPAAGADAGLQKP